MVDQMEPLEKVHQPEPNTRVLCQLTAYSFSFRLKKRASGVQSWKVRLSPFQSQLPVPPDLLYQEIALRPALTALCDVEAVAYQ